MRATLSKGRSQIGVAVGGLLAMLLIGPAQPADKVAHIGFLSNTNATVGVASAEAFRQGLRELGWIEGQNIVIDYRWADGDMDRHAALASELVKLPVDVILTAGPQAVRAAQKATSTIPIVVAIMPDPVTLGFAASFARPGGNVTGLASVFEELTPKQLQILKETLPRATRIAMLSAPGMGDGIQSASEAAARALSLKARVFQIRDVPDLEVAFSTARAEHADGVLVLPSPFFNRNRQRIAELAVKYRQPTISESREYVQDGGLMSYGPNFPGMYRRVARYVDLILKGAKPGDLPIERPTKFELVINARTAKALGLTIPQSVLIRADELIQ